MTTTLKFPSGEEMHLDTAANQPRDKMGQFASTGGGGGPGGGDGPGYGGMTSSQHSENFQKAAGESGKVRLVQSNPGTSVYGLQANGKTLATLTVKPNDAWVKPKLEITQNGRNYLMNSRIAQLKKAFPD